jgi:uncharacterized membrane protein YeaQ/YmgE (transglycosylase-associated protein family)
MEEGATMIAMGFSSFATLLVVGFIGSFTLHVPLRYRALAGPEGFLAAWILGWFGAWVGSPVVGHWGPHVGGQYILPALLGAFGVPFFAVSVFRALKMMLETPHPESAFSGAGSAPRVEMRKAS